MLSSISTSVAASIVAAIPSPSSGSLHLGPFQLRAYGLMIALGVIAAVALGGRRLEWAGTGKRDDLAAAAMWGVPAGVIGARLYHVATDWKSFKGDWGRVFKIWEGGLGIWGGIGLGVIVGVWAMRRRSVSAANTLGAVAPALALAQAIGRWGNWWNQELFGRPTTLPWALKIDPANRPAAYANSATFHPTFLYESLWNLALCGALLWIDRRYRPRPLRLFAMYVAGYTVARFFIERLRVDKASLLLGLRVNEWVAALIFLAAVAYLVATRGMQRDPVRVFADGELDYGDGDGELGRDGVGVPDGGNEEHVGATGVLDVDDAAADVAQPRGSDEAGVFDIETEADDERASDVVGAGAGSSVLDEGERDPDR